MAADRPSDNLQALIDKLAAEDPTFAERLEESREAERRRLASSTAVTTPWYQILEPP